MAWQIAARHLPTAAIAAATVPANLALGVAWQLALLAGGAVLLFGVLLARLPAARRSSTPTAAPAPAGSYPLTRREVDVAILVAQGMTNKAIARQLFNSERTIDSHVQHIYNKLNIDSRAQLALWMQERGLLTSAVRGK
jgi:DNA-binding NarL/FixJ family response regulator